MNAPNSTSKRFSKSVATLAAALIALLLVPLSLHAGRPIDIGGTTTKADGEGGESVPAVSIGDDGIGVFGPLPDVLGTLAGLERGEVRIDPVDPTLPDGDVIATFAGSFELHVDPAALAERGVRIVLHAPAGGHAAVRVAGQAGGPVALDPSRSTPVPLSVLAGERATTIGLSTARGLQRIDIVDEGNLFTLRAGARWSPRVAER